MTARLPRMLVTIAGAALLAGTPGGLPSAEPRPTWVPDSEVAAVLPVDGRVYLGGFFTQLAPRTGSGVVYNLHSRERETQWPEIAGGRVESIAGDGRGGWFIGGSFDYVGGVARRGLAHLLSTGQLDRRWNAHPNGDVLDVVRQGQTLLLAGRFTRVGGTARRGIAALSAARGAATGWHARPAAMPREIGAVAVSGTTAFVGGTSGERLLVAKIDLRSGMTRKVFRFRAEAEHDTPNIARMDVSGRRLFFSGDFEALNGKRRNGIAALDSLTGRMLAWNPRPDAFASVLGLSGTGVYVGGFFRRIGGASRRGVAEVDRRSGRATAWHPQVDGNVLAAERRRNVVYLVGKFTKVEGMSRMHLAAVGARAGDVRPWNPAGPAFGPDGFDASLAIQGGRLFVGGDFTSAGGVTRTGLGAIDARTGAALPWGPKLGVRGEDGPDGLAWSFAAAAGRLYVAGIFDHVDREPRAGVAAFDLRTGGLTDWAPRADDYVRGFSYADGVVFLGGDFNRINGQPRSGVAAFDAATGTLLPFHADVQGAVFTLLATPTKLFVGGRFDSIGGVHCKNLAAIDLTSGRVLSDWCPQPDEDVNALALSQTALYVVGQFDRVSGQARESAAAVQPDTGVVLPWNPKITCPCVDDVDVDNSIVFLAGVFDRAAGLRRNGLAAFDANTGGLLPWAPKLQDSADTIRADDAAVYVGGFFSSAHALAQSYFATFPR